MILMTVAVAIVFAGRVLDVSVAPLVWICAMVGTSMVAASASVLNQWYERDRDSMMPRTQKRPLPSGRLTTGEASVFGWLLLVAGLTLLAVGTNATAVAVSFATWFIYCCLVVVEHCGGHLTRSPPRDDWLDRRRWRHRFLEGLGAYFHRDSLAVPSLHGNRMAI